MEYNNELLGNALNELSTREGGTEALKGIAQGLQEQQAIPQAPSVITSKTARDLTFDNKSYLNNIEAGLNQTPPQIGGVLNISPSITNPAQNQLSGQINELVSGLDPKQKQTLLTSASQELLNRINDSTGSELALTSKARQAELSGDFYTLNNTIKQIKDSQDQRTKDLEELQKELSPLKKQLMQSYVPTAEEKDLGTQIADIQYQMKAYDIETQKLVYGLEGQGRGIISGIVSGQQAKLQKQRALDAQTMAARESNLIARLGLAQDARKAQQNALANGISMLQDDYELQSKLQDTIDTQNEKILSQVKTLKEEARNVLAFILEQFQGIDFDELPAESKKAIEELAKSSGLDTGIITAGLKAIKDQQDFDNLIKESKEESTPPASYREWELAGGLAGTGKTYADYLAKPADEKITKTNIREAIDSELKANNAFGKDKKVSFETYQWMRQNWLNNDGKLEEFYQTYPIKQYLDENNMIEYEDTVSSDEEKYF